MEQSSDVELAAIDEAFRQQIRAWLAEHLVGEFKAVGGVGGPADDEAWDVRLAWERELAAARWLNISWPEEYGGRGGTPRQELLFQIEHAKANAPYWVGIQGRDLFGPTPNGAWSKVYCGGGSESVCRQRLQDSLREALAVTPQELYGHGDCEDDPEPYCFDQNRSVSTSAISIPPTPFQNRPTFQQTVSVGRDLP